MQEKREYEKQEEENRNDQEYIFKEIKDSKNKVRAL